MVFFRYDDIPGVIGRVGTMFGEAGVNIANMAVSRTKEGGKALMALSIDSTRRPELVERIRGGGLRRRPLHHASDRGGGSGRRPDVALMVLVVAWLGLRCRRVWPTACSSATVADRRSRVARRRARLRLARRARSASRMHTVPAAARETRRAHRDRARTGSLRHPIYGGGLLFFGVGALVERAGDARRARARRALVAQAARARRRISAARFPGTSDYRRRVRDSATRGRRALGRLP